MYQQYPYIFMYQCLYAPMSLMSLYVPRSICFYVSWSLFSLYSTIQLFINICYRPQIKDTLFKKDQPIDLIGELKFCALKFDYFCVNFTFD